MRNAPPATGPSLIVLIYLVVVCFAAAAIVATPDRSTQLEAEHYCRMVWIHWHDSRYGWPDYAGVYAEQCHRDGSVNEDYVHGR